MSTDYVPRETLLDACPSCSSSALVCVVGTQLDCCTTCYRVWERLPAGEPYTQDDEQMPFRIPCDDCAFRGGSDERAAAGRWQALQQSLSTGGEFYCHKGVPFKATPDGAHHYEFPRRLARVDLAGESYPYQAYDKSRMRLCRGYLNAHVGPLVKKVFARAKI